MGKKGKGEAFLWEMKESGIVVIRPVSVSPVRLMINGVGKIKQTLIRPVISMPIQRSKSSVAGFILQRDQINGVIEQRPCSTRTEIFVMMVMRLISTGQVHVDLLVLPLKRRRIGNAVTEPKRQCVVGGSYQAGEGGNLRENTTVPCSLLFHRTRF